MNIRRISSILLFLLAFSGCFQDDNQLAEVRVACVGNSITQGSWLADPATQSFPSVLAQLLGEKYVVENFGYSGRCVQKDADGPYWGTEPFLSARASGADVVILMLGTNDSKPYNWVGDSAFTADYNSMIDTLLSMPSKPAVWPCLPLPAFSDSFDVCGPTIQDSIVPRIRDIATKRGLNLIDTHTPFSDHSEYFPDGVHPNTDGAALIASIIAQALRR